MLTNIIGTAVAFAANGDAKSDSVSKNILLICSYPPDAPSVAKSISDFNRACQDRGKGYNLIVETLNCRNLPEINEWKPRMINILKNYFVDGSMPDVVVILGAEASSVYFSLDKNMFDGSLTKVPVFLGSRSRNIVLLPDSEIDFVNWRPESKDVIKDLTEYNIIGGRLVEYDVKKNVDVIHKLYPAVDSLLFVSDNTLGGVTMQAFVREKAALIKGFGVGYCDGRRMNFKDMKNTIADIKGNNIAIVMGTWRVDRTGNFVINSATGSFIDDESRIPVFSLSSVGLFNFGGDTGRSIGGYVPDYDATGTPLAEECMNFLELGVKKGLTVLENHYVFNYQLLKDLNISENKLPQGFEYINKPDSFWERHAKVIYTMSAIVLVLVLMFIIVSYYLYRINKLNMKLVTLNEEMSLAKDRAEEANRLKTSFLANMSHEIRTPLNAIVGFSSIITSGDVPLSDEEKAEMGELIRTNTDVLLKLINDILDLSRIESGKMSFEMKSLEIVSLCQSVLTTAEQSSQNSAVKYILDMQTDKLDMVTDENRLRQVLINLLSNAAKCTAAGSITLGLRVDDARKQAVFSVTDTGCGIPKEKIDRVFERFEKLDEFKQGTGLGLSICRTIVEKFGGKIWVDAEYTSGARFVFTHEIK